jgi:hypothetical protein
MDTFHADAICTPEEAAWACRIAATRTVEGCGYNGNTDPMGNGTPFRGARVSGPPSRFDGDLGPSERSFLVELLERMKRHLEAHDPKVLLRCGYATLTVRGPTPGAKPGDLSHPFHSDSESYGERDKWRTHSAVLYLNTDFAGGVFCLPGAGDDEGVGLQPAVGRMVGFDADQVHGVTAVTAGERVTLVGWYEVVG